MPHRPAWSHALSVRNARLDEQHIIMMELSNELLELLRDASSTDAAIVKVLTEFADYARRHDALEEGLLEANACPTLKAHRAVHRASEAELSGWLTAAATQMLDRKALAACFESWMAHHLTETDMPVKGYLHD